MAPWPDLDLTGTLDGFLGLDYERAEPGHLVATVALREEFLGDDGDLRTGIAAAIAESMCSYGTALTAVPKGLVPLSSEIDTMVVARPTGERLRAEAKLIAESDDLGFWDGYLTTVDGSLIALTQVTMVVRPSGLPAPALRSAT
jgi:acyl-coenzyme A thioesterase PaaI-like protein